MITLVITRSLVLQLNFFGSLESKGIQPSQILYPSGTTKTLSDCVPGD